MTTTVHSTQDRGRHGAPAGTGSRFPRVLGLLAQVAAQRVVRPHHVHLPCVAEAGIPRKEAFVKATGEGLGRGLNTFSVLGDRPPELDEWTFLSFDPAPGYLPSRGAPHANRCHRSRSDGRHPR